MYLCFTLELHVFVLFTTVISVFFSFNVYAFKVLDILLLVSV